MHVGCSMERGRHGGKAEGRRVRNRPCDVAHRSEVCGSRTLLGPCVASSSLGMLYGARVALGPSWGRAWQHREVPSPVRAYPCLCRRTTGACTGDEGAVRVQGRRGRGSGAWCAHATCGRSALEPPFTMRKEGLFSRPIQDAGQPRRELPGRWPRAPHQKLLLHQTMLPHGPRTLTNSRGHGQKSSGFAPRTPA